MPRLHTAALRRHRLRAPPHRQFPDGPPRLELVPRGPPRLEPVGWSWCPVALHGWSWFPPPRGANANTGLPQEPKDAQIRDCCPGGACRTLIGVGPCVASLDSTRPVSSASHLPCAAGMGTPCSSSSGDAHPHIRSVPRSWLLLATATPSFDLE